MEKTKRPIAFVLASTDHGTMILNRNDEQVSATRRWGVGIEILTEGSFCAEEIELVLKLLELRRQLYGDGVTAIDCGANIGVHSIDWGRRMAAWGRVISIEAQERIYYALAGNIVINNCFNVTALNAAASDRDGEMLIPVPDYTKQASFGSLELRLLANPENIGQPIDYRDEAMRPVRALRIDSLKLDRLDLLKIDVEGMEIDVLRGAAESLRRFKPILMVEQQKTDTAAMKRLIQDSGYRLFNIDSMNLLAVHADDKSIEHIVEAGA